MKPPETLPRPVVLAGYALAALMLAWMIASYPQRSGPIALRPSGEAHR
jgi:hypothetical protein